MSSGGLPGQTRSGRARAYPAPPPGSITVTSAHDIPALAAWRNGPMVLIGDAAHAASPATAQGVSMSLEDAVTLARCLRDIPDTPVVLAAYEHLRRDRTERVVQIGARSGTNPVPPSPGTRMEGPPAWLLDHYIEWNESVSLPAEVLPPACPPCL